ncbi:hypothetical protein LAZ67_14002967 [Cordylochernes scorpioides]|uniref:Tc1-like transposase DDE domain-containing protein n=1 Tax=Cordylochernes scorpioides TaxID=51811 RepID=A0ABY6LC51_9ARAC|nr:hypothetical protein LAZ67_14002967 [Cordylochernes scorpioides]
MCEHVHHGPGLRALRLSPGPPPATRASPRPQHLHLPLRREPLGPNFRMLWHDLHDADEGQQLEHVHGWFFLIYQEMGWPNITEYLKSTYRRINWMFLKHELKPTRCSSQERYVKLVIQINQPEVIVYTQKPRYEDNARPHTAYISQQALQDVHMLPWPPYYPDLSSIEHVWDIIGRCLHALPQSRSEDELWKMVGREWREIPQDAILV